MGNNTLQTRSAGETITADFFNDFNTALQTEFVGRNASGAATSGQGLGSSSVPWGTGYFNSIVLGGDALDATQITAPANRIVSGSTRSSSNQPYFLKANGSAASVQITGNTTNLVVDVNGSSVTCSTDITISSLTTAPSSNNTCLVNMADAADQELTRYWGEPENKFVLLQAKDAENPFYDHITVDTMGSNITGLVGSYAAFKINDGTNDEYFIAYVESTTKLSKIIRGAFLDNTGLPVNRVKFANNDTITLMKLSWIFLQNDGTTTDVTYTPPVWSTTAPGSPATGDYWYDFTVSQWKRYSGSAFVAINRTLLGVCIQDTSNCKATRSFDFYYKAKDRNSIDLVRKDNTNVIFKSPHSNVWVYSKDIDFSLSAPEFNITTDLLATATKDAYATESASTYYYLYVKDTGELAMSDIGPRYRGDLLGSYHPSNPFRCVGVIFNNSSSNLEGLPLVENNKLLPALGFISHENSANGTWGGDLGASNTWTIRTLDTLKGETWFIEDLSSNTFVLSPGFYKITGQAPLYAGDQHKIRLYNITDGSVTITGCNAYASNAYNGQSPALIYGSFEITSSKEYRIEHILQTDNGGISQGGFDSGGSNSGPSIFTTIMLEKLR